MTRPYIHPRHIAKAMNDSRAIANARVDLARELGRSWAEPYRSRYGDDRASTLSRLVATFAICFALFCIVYFAAELLRSAWL